MQTGERVTDGVVCQAVVDDIDWSAVDDLGCGIELEVSGDAKHPQLVTEGITGKLLLLRFHALVIRVRVTW